ncbi:MAG: PDZ domain-containing protein [Streptococcaceae bacterium]|nr:PDZ domain-containing protein [Streptococcaceae bacterium]MCL2681354.1 PDZ domain-containing protein [Streptococcaceae bacterium]MCL2858421.1 PDZ domain-containing protein [Streptococcaceae bacterium]
MDNQAQKKKGIKKALKWLIPILLFVIVMIGLVVPLPYYIELPGTTQAINQMVQIKGKQDDKNGVFALTTVEIAQANGAELIASKFNPFATVYSQQDMMGGLSSQQFMVVNQFYMQTAQNTAVAQAFKLANKPVDMKYDGVYVMSVANESNFKNDFQIADTITSVDGHTFKSSKDLIQYVSEQKVGQSVNIAFTRMDGSKHTATNKLIKLPNNKAGIGITLTDHTEAVTDPAVTIDAGNIGGPSAGMMFTLEIYSQITGKDLRQGRNIAGTGTIEVDGTVGQIGGVDKKVATASREGMSIFLAPDSGTKTNNNYLDAQTAAKKLNTQMKIVPIKTVQDAVTYLETGKIID